jgi:hypothetical protein
MDSGSEEMIRLVVAAAESLPASVTPAAKELVSDRFSAETWEDSAGKMSQDRVTHHLPRFVEAVRVEKVPVLLGSLEGPVTQVGLRDALRRDNNQALITRSWLGQDAPNLQLFLIGPEASMADQRWRDAAVEMEADDRICRKLVWLPPASPSIEDARAFLRRTFLAKPWESHGAAADPRLDRLSGIQLPDGWLDAIEDESLDSDSLVSRLIEISE